MALRSFKSMTASVSRNLTSLINSQAIRTMSSQVLPSRSNELPNLTTISVTVPKPFVFHVALNRPNKLNALSREMWSELKECFEQLNTNPDCRVIVLSGAGKLFTAGIDLNSMLKLGQELAEFEDVSRKGLYMGTLIKLYQDSISSLEVCSKPVISAVHSACVGAGVDLITACDIRYCTEDAWFQVKEVDIGMAADVGTLQRLPKVIGSQSLARELCFTGRKMDSKEANDCGLISKVFKDKELLLNGALELAENIASKSPVAVQATKTNMIYSLDHTNQEGLDQIREMNKLLLQSEDFLTATAAQLTKAEKPIFSKL